MKIWITRQEGLSLQFGGIERVMVWFFEPCLTIRQIDNEMFPSEDSDFFKTKKQLDGILYGRNCIHNFLYRSENNVNSIFGDKLIRNSDGIDFPIILEDLYKQHKLSFEHTVFLGGHGSSYTENNARQLFGYPDDYPELSKAPDVANKIWSLVAKDFDGIEFDKWHEYEKEKPWWRFCKQLEIDIKLKQ